MEIENVQIKEPQVENQITDQDMEAERLLYLAYKECAVYINYETKEETYFPEGKDQLDSFKQHLENAKDAGATDSEMIDNIKRAESLYQSWNELSFVGSYIYLVLAGLVSAFIVFRNIIGFDFMGIIWAIVYLGGSIGYIWANQAPYWLVETKNITKGSSILGFITSLIKGTPKTKYYYDDGVSVRQEDYDTEFSMMVVRYLVFGLLYLGAAFLVPLVTLVSYLRFRVLLK